MYNPIYILIPGFISYHFLEQTEASVELHLAVCVAMRLCGNYVFTCDPKNTEHLVRIFPIFLEFQS